jgi:RND superfamily putative drug exporter
VVPLKATIGFLGSVAATFGAVVAVFQWGWLTDVLGVESTGPIMSMLPILLIGVLFGLAMDYQVFLVTRMREEHVHGAEPQDAMVTGFRHGARVVVAAALIMISVFAGFVLAESTLIQSIGFALAFGVLVDAFVVRMTLVPAVMSLLGRGAWWLPKWLDRILPDVDVEGEKLTKQLDDAPGDDPRELVGASR